MSTDRVHPRPAPVAADTSEDLRWMQLALEEAARAGEADEVPIGAVVVREGVVLGRAHNRTRTLSDPTAHAELLAISAAARGTAAMRLPGSVLYTTVEPCFMCAGALVHARVRRVVWAVRDPKFGGCASLGAVLDAPGQNHAVEHSEGVCADEARELLVKFFQRKRAAVRS
jgi:tRNA(adenine34) deaminase